MLNKLILCTVAAVSTLAAQDIRHIQPEGLSKTTAYSHVVTAKPGTVIWVAGQVAQNAKGELVGKGDLKAQVDQVWANVKTALAAAGASFRDVVKVNTYVVNYKPSMRELLREARRKHMGDDVAPPASTLAGVQSLATDDFLVEIEVTAVIR